MTRMKRSPAWHILILIAAITAAAVMFLAGYGTHHGWWGFRRGLVILRWSTYSELALAVAALAAFIAAAYRRSGSAVAAAIIASAISLGAVMLPLRMWTIFRSVPMIHDITTDTENPPRMEALLAVRKNALNPAEYGGQEIAAQQRAAYPDILPLILRIPPAAAFDRCLAAAKKLGWYIAREDRGQGIIEATATTFWFRFKDDVVVRISPEGNGSRIDMRSVSRVGKSDVGTNARRIRTFLGEVEQADR